MNRVSLNRIIPWRQVRAMVYRKLNKYDLIIYKKAHFPKYRPKLTLGFSKYCAENNYIDLIHWSRRIGLRWNPECEDIAAFNGSTQVVQWILQKNRPDINRLTNHAARVKMIAFIPTVVRDFMAPTGLNHRDECAA